MASSTALSASSLLLLPSAVADPSSLACASSKFLASALPVAPLNRTAAAAALASARCSLSNENQPPSNAAARREILAGLASVGAALAVFSNASLAAIGPGTSGAERTARKADDLLKAADKLNIEDAPKRFGPGRAGDAQEGGKIAQQAGSGAFKGLQQGVGDVAKELSKASGDIEKKFKQQGVGDVAKEVSKASGDIEKKVKNIYGQFVARKGAVESAGKDVVGQAQKKGSEVTGGGGFFGSIKQSVKGIKGSIPQ